MRSREEIELARTPWSKTQRREPTVLENNTFLILEVLLDIRELLEEMKAIQADMNLTQRLKGR